MTDSGSENTTAPLDLVPLPGSERAAAPGIQPAGVELSPDEVVDVTLIVRRKAVMSTEDALGEHLTRDELGARFGADPADVELVESTLGSLGLEILETDLPSRRIRVSGSVELVSRIFGTSLTGGSSANGSSVHRIRTGGLSIPAALDGIVTAVLGIDNRPQSRPQFRVSGAQAAAVSYTPLQLGTIYKFPKGTDGSGQIISIIELGGGFETSDLSTYFAGLGITEPSVTAVGVDGATNVPGQDPTGADGEVLLDIEVAGALAPAAQLLVYFAPNTDAGFLDAVSQAAHASPAPTTMSISWGQSEDQWTAQARSALDDAILDAVALGVTVTVAAGDNGSADGEPSGNHTDFPASSPHALACGGTSLRAKGTKISSETVWNDGSGGGATGGGVSDVFGLPAWQKNAGVPTVASPGGRGVPDVAGDADPDTGYQVLVDGSRTVYGGTSAVAPLWAALVARLAQANGASFGLIQPKLYSLTAGFHDITTGSNGAYDAAKGWDPCTGLGSPNGKALSKALAAAG